MDFLAAVKSYSARPVPKIIMETAPDQQASAFGMRRAVDKASALPTERVSALEITAARTAVVASRTITEPTARHIVTP